jgi:hypothetical protein
MILFLKKNSEVRRHRLEVAKLNLKSTFRICTYLSKSKHSLNDMTWWKSERRALDASGKVLLEKVLKSRRYPSEKYSTTGSSF